MRLAACDGDTLIPGQTRWPPDGWTTTTPSEKGIKIEAKVVSDVRHVLFQLAEAAVPRPLFADILDRIDLLRTLGVPKSL